MDTFGPGLLEERPGERELHHGLATREGQAPARLIVERPVPHDFSHDGGDITLLAYHPQRTVQARCHAGAAQRASTAVDRMHAAAELMRPNRTRSLTGPARHAMEPNRVLFEGLSRLAPKADTTYRVRVQGLQPGDLRIRVQLTTDEIRTPVTKEESTRVYSDE